MDSRRARLPGEAATAETTPSGIQFAGLDLLLGYQLRRAQGAVHRDYLAAVGELKLTQKQTAVLWLVSGNPGVSQGTIGTALGMDRATMMELVNRLEGRGLLLRRRSSIDARRRELHLTRSGARLLEQVRARVASHEERMKRQFSAAELRTLEGLLGRLQEL